MPHQRMPNSLQVKDVRKHFAQHNKDLPVLAGISFQADPGQVVAILGKSGSGKTTLLNIISKLESTDSGSVNFDGEISYTPQKDLLLPWRTVKANALLPFEIHHSSNGSQKNKIDVLLKEVGLNDFAGAYPSELSGGMRQKASLVRSLAQDTPLYIFDEALSAIDFDSRLKLAREIRSYIVTKKKIGLFVTHNIEEAISVADKVVVLSSRPAKVVYETNIKISENDRDPVAIRKNPEFQHQFETIWKFMTQS